MKESGVNLQQLGKRKLQKQVDFKAILLTTLLYPLQRIQNIQQIQSSYANPTNRNTSSIISQAIHYGRKSYFRGLSTFTLKATLLTTAIHTAESFTTQHNNNKIISSLLSSAIIAANYLLFYPLQVINTRMSVQLQKQRFYQTVRNCASKIKRNQGIKTFYRGFLYSCALFTAQLVLIKQTITKFNGIRSDYSQWQQAAIYIAIIAASQILIYPFNTVKKLYQVNGGLGHSDQNYTIRRAFQTTSLSSMYKGISTKLLNLSLYTLLYCWMLTNHKTE